MKNEDTGRAQATENRTAPDPVLVAVDFTPDSKAAVGWASQFADSVEAPLQVLHVVHDPEDAPGSYHQNDDDQLQPIDEIAAEMMETFLADLRGAIPGSPALAEAQPLLVTGIPETRILEVAERIKAQIIVMGSRGRTGLPHLLLGSKAERVVQRSPVPVTIVKAEDAHD